MTITRQTCINVFGYITLFLIIITTIRLITFVSISMSASIHLHNNMFNTLIRATIYFFNTNLSGNNNFKYLFDFLIVLFDFFV